MLRALHPRAALFVLALAGPAPLRAQAAAPDLVLSNGRVFTADSARPWAQAVAVRGDRVVAVGGSDEIEALAGPRTRIIDLGGRLVVPGFNDAHVHLGPEWPGAQVSHGTGTFADPDRARVGDSLGAAVRRAPPGTWLSMEVGERALSDATLRRAFLDSVSPAHPVRLHAWSGHGLVFNSAALRLLGTPLDAPDPAGGWYERDAAGRLTGLAHEYAGYSAGRRTALAQPVAAARAAVHGTLAAAAALGITTLQTFTTNLPPAALRPLLAGAPGVRVRVVDFPMERFGEPRRTGGTPGQGVEGVKYIVDGTPVERLALERAPYADRSGWHGRANLPPATLRRVLADGLRSREQLHLHVVGDSSAALVLGLMAAVGDGEAWTSHRLRIEHGDGLAPDLQQAARRLGVVVVQNPSHLMIGDLARTRLGAERLSTYQPLRSLLSAGIPLALGSDGPMNPFLNLMFAVTYPSRPGEALTREQAITAYTLGSAFAERRERDKGRLAPGMLADLAVLSQDIFTVPADALPGTTSVLTLVGGRVVHDAGLAGTGTPGSGGR